MIYKILIVMIFFSVSITCFAQVKIEMKTGVTYTGFIISENDSLIKFKSLDNIIWDIPKELIKFKRPIVYNFKTIKGEKYTGTLIKPPDSNYTINQSDGLTVLIPRKDVMSIIKNNYDLFGITFGLPGGLNILFGYHFDDMAIRAEIGGFPSIFGLSSAWGLQANICYNLSNSKLIEQNISIGAGYQEISERTGWFGLLLFLISERKDIKRTYIGAFYDLIIDGYFIEAGMTIGWGSVLINQQWILFPSTDLNNQKGSISQIKFSFQIGYVFRNND